MWPASLVAPKPTISPRISAPRRARVLERLEHEHRRAFGEHEPLPVRAERTAGLLGMLVVDGQHAQRFPRPDDARTSSGASAPPAIIASACPARIACTASPIACALDAQAETTAYDSPFAPNFVETARAAALYIDNGIDGRRDARVLGVEAAIAAVERLAAAEPRADERRRRGRARRPSVARLLPPLPRRR